MEFRSYRVTTKKYGTVQHLHTASCPKGGNYIGLYRKIDVAFAEDAKAIAEAPHKAGVPFKGTWPNVLMQCKCLHLFRKPLNTNPPCPHCGNNGTVFASNMGVGRKEFSCSACKKLFVNVRTAKDRPVKIKISKSSRSKAKKMAREEKQVARAAAKAERLEARAARKAERAAAKTARADVRAAKQGTRAKAKATRLKKKEARAKKSAVRNAARAKRAQARMAAKADWMAVRAATKTDRLAARTLRVVARNDRRNARRLARIDKLITRLRTLLHAGEPTAKSKPVQAKKKGKGKGKKR
jgi:hypothetical protein